MANQLFANNASVQLISTFGIGVSTLVLPEGTGDLFPVIGTDQYFLVTLHTVNYDQWEIIKVNARSGDTLSSIDRAYEGIQYAWSAGEYASTNITRKTMELIHSILVTAQTKSDDASNQLTTILRTVYGYPDVNITYDDAPGSTFAPDASDSNVQHIVLDQAVTVGMPIWESLGTKQVIQLYLVSNNYTATWNGSYNWIGSTPTLSGDQTYVLEISTIDAGTTTYIKHIDTYTVNSDRVPEVFAGYAIGLAANANDWSVDKIDMLTHTISERYVQFRYFESDGTRLTQDWGANWVGVATNMVDTLYGFGGQIYGAGTTSALFKFTPQTEVSSYINSLKYSTNLVCCTAAHDVSTQNNYINVSSSSLNNSMEKFSYIEVLTVLGDGEYQTKQTAVCDDGTKYYGIGGDHGSSTTWFKFTFATEVVAQQGAIGYTVFGNAMSANDNSGTNAFYWVKNNTTSKLVFSTDTLSSATGDPATSFTVTPRACINDKLSDAALVGESPIGNLFNYSAETLTRTTAFDVTNTTGIVPGYGADHAHT